MTSCLPVRLCLPPPLAYPAGTPKGVGALQPGQSVHAGLQLPGESKVISELRLHVQERRGNFQFRG